MRINQDILKSEEKATFQLRALYQKYGYSQFKMGKFEEYELYAKNKDFISADSIITFTDTSGKLMAMKPDLTLSIVKNYRHIPGYVEKVYYSENIYRESKTAHTYNEILQTGLECLGDLDVMNICEVTMLAAKSLAAISQNYVLEISHMGIIAAMVHPFEEDVKNQIIKCIGEKNIHEIKKICHAHNIEEKTINDLETLVSTYGNYKRVLAKLRKLELNGEGVKALEELETVCQVLAGGKLTRNLNIDFSIVNDMTYYSGILYKGFVEGIPTSILSGGRYDKLMGKMGKKSGAIGFAVYLDSLDRLDNTQKEYDVDVVFIYDMDTDFSGVLRESKQITDAGETVLIEKVVPEKLKYKKLVKLEEGKVVILEQND